MGSGKYQGQGQKGTKIVTGAPGSTGVSAQRWPVSIARPVSSVHWVGLVVVVGVGASVVHDGCVCGSH